MYSKQFYRNNKERENVYINKNRENGIKIVRRNWRWFGKKYKIYQRFSPQLLSVISLPLTP